MAESARQGATIIEDTTLPALPRPHSALVWIVAIAALLSGALLTGFATWRQPLVDAGAAAAAGDWSRALAQYEAGEARFTDWPIAQRLFPAVYRATLANQLAARFHLGDLDGLLEKADTIPATAASHFWVGAALFEKSQAEQNAEARLGWLARATDEFKGALELERDTWDVIYDYELAKRLFEELRKKPKTPPKQLLELLRPQPKEGSRPVKKVG